MKFLGTVLGSLIFGILMASSGFHPLQRFVETKRRAFNAALLGASGFIFVMAGILIGLIEAALQYEAQGFVFWSALLTLSISLLGVGAVCAVTAKLVMPRFLPERLINFAGLNEGHFDALQFVEGWLRQNYQPTAAPPQTETQVTEEREPSHQPQSAAFHHSERPQFSH